MSVLFFVNQKDYIGATCIGNGNNGSGCQVIQKAKLIPDEILTITDGKISAVTNSFGLSFEILTASANTERDMKAAIVDVPIPLDLATEICGSMDYPSIYIKFK
ncbi:MAG: hypothetical protein IKO06_06715 [Alphaproteobacteria bacterium]|nr:hypothetical protein [Alphaproteobacteria bacterium]